MSLSGVLRTEWQVKLHQIPAYTSRLYLHGQVKVKCHDVITFDLWVKVMIFDLQVKVVTFDLDLGVKVMTFDLWVKVTQNPKHKTSN